jgi:hypothetical protein
MDRTTIAALVEHQDRQRAEAAAYGPGYRDSGYVFTRLNGGPDGAAVGAPGARRGRGHPRQTCAVLGAPGEVYVAARINDIHGA